MFGTGKLDITIVDAVPYLDDNTTKQSHGFVSSVLKDKAYQVSLRRQILGDDDDGIDE